MAHGVIEDNVINDAASSGIVVVNPGGGGPMMPMAVGIRNNSVMRVGGVGISVTCPPGAEEPDGGCLLSENQVQRANQGGIRLENMAGCKVHNNVLWANGGDGILWVSGGRGLVLDNVASENQRSGIRIEEPASEVQLDNNVMNHNVCFGLHLLGGGHTYGRNGATGNLGICPACPPISMPPQCWPSSTGPPPGPGNIPPDFCDAGSGNRSFCNNLMPGPPPL